MLTANPNNIGSPKIRNNFDIAIAILDFSLNSNMYMLSLLHALKVNKISLFLLSPFSKMKILKRLRATTIAFVKL